MFRETLQLFVVVAGVAFATAIPAQEHWSVRGDAVRDQKIVKRYQQLLLHKPDHAIAYRSLLSKLGRGPALDPLIEEVRAIAEAGSSAEPYILLGHLERDRGRAAASLAAYQKAVSLEADNPGAHAALGAALERAGHAAAANASFERALELTTSSAARQKLLRTLSDNAATRGDHGRAADWMQQIVALRPHDYDLRTELADMQLRAHRFDEALESFEAAYDRAGRSGKRRAQTLLDMGNVHRRMDDHVAAERAYRRSLQLIGASSWMRREVLMRLLDVARDNGQLASMYDELRREWASPSYHDAMVLAGIAEELMRDEDAVKWLERAMRLDRRAIEPRTRLIARLDHVADAARIKALYAEIVALRPDDLGQRLERIEWLFLRAGRAEEAMKALASLEAELASDATSLVEIANTYVAFGLPDPALRIHAGLQKTAPDHLLHLEAYGELLTRLGRTEDAAAVWKHLFAVDTDEVGARLRVAEIAARQQQYDRAIELLEWVVAKYPRLVNARQRLAGVYETTKRWPQALEQWETLFFDYEVDHAKRQVLAIAQRTAFIGDDAISPDRALLDRWEARYAADRSVRTGAVLVHLRSLMDTHETADALGREIVGRAPADLPVSDHAAWVEVAHYMVGRTPDANEQIRILARIADAFGDRRAESWRKALDIAVLSGTDLEMVLERALDASPNDPYVHATAGDVARDRGEVEAAIGHYWRAISLGTKSFETHFDLAHLLKENERLDEARSVYVEVIRTDWAGTWAKSAMYSALDICETDADRRELAAEFEGLRGRMQPNDLHATAVAVYQELFVYGDDPAALFESLGRDALPHLVAAVQAHELADHRIALKLLKLYPTEMVVDTALRVWPKDAKSWGEPMVRVLSLGTTAEVDDAILAAFDSAQEDARLTALFVAGTRRLHAAQPRLLALLHDVTAVTPEARLAAATLGRLGTAQARERLGELSRAKDPELRRVALWAMAQGDNPEAMSMVAEHLQTRHSAEFAGAVLNGAGEHGLRELLRAAWSADASRRAVAWGGLRTTSIDPWVRFGEHLDISYIEPDRLIERAIEAAEKPGTGLVAQSFLHREEVVVQETEAHLETTGAVVLGDLLEAAQEVEDAGMEELAPSLKRVVRGIRPRLRKLVLTAPPETLAPAVMLLPLAEQQRDVELIAKAAGRLPEGEAAEALARLSRYPWKSTRAALLNGMRADEVLRRAAAVRAIARSDDAAGDVEVTALIVKLAADPAPEVQVAAIEALGQLRHADSVDMLTTMHDEAVPIVQAAIRRNLRRLPGDRAKEAARRFEVRATLPVCEGDPHDLTDLLRDDCAGAVQISDF